jgi:alpha-tubulin suppressor-like RCC1 family protein
VSLNFIGVIIIALLPPTQAKLAERDKAQAEAIRDALTSVSLTNTAGPVSASGIVITPQVRQELLAEAIRRDPTLVAAQDPESLKRLGEAMTILEQEYVLKTELRQLRVSQETAAEGVRRAREEAERQARLAARQEQMAEQDRQRQLEDAARAAQAEAAAAAADRERLAAMRPVSRWITTHRSLLAGTLALVVVAASTAAIYAFTRPPAPPPPLSIVLVASGGAHSCALTSTGGVRCWGNNGSGQLGDGTTAERATAAQVIGLESGVKALTAGEHHTCALRDTGAVVCWGRNAYGQLGDGTNFSSLVPVPVAGLGTSVQAISAGASFTCALLVDGAATCWGSNTFGELGDGSTQSRNTPKPVRKLEAGASSISAGYGHVCVVSLKGAVLCWGGNPHGELGDGKSTSRPVPVAVVGLKSAAQTVSAGRGHTCAVLIDGSAACWGDNSDGQLGDGTRFMHVRAVPVSTLATAVASISAGTGFTCAIRTEGAAMCWGGNATNQLGDPSITGVVMPAQVPGIDSGAKIISAGEGHACAVMADQSVTCWGDNVHGQSGQEQRSNRSLPASVSSLK